MNAGRTRRVGKARFQLFVSCEDENVAKWTIAREIGRERKKERKEGRNAISPARTEKGRRGLGCATQKVLASHEKRASVLEIGPGVSRLITLGSGDVVTRERRNTIGAHERHDRETEAAVEGWKEKRPFLFESPKRDDATRHDDETLTEFSSDSRGAEREMAREEETIYYRERRAEEVQRERNGEGVRDWRESGTPPPQTTSPFPLLVSPRSASPRLASPTVNHLRFPVPKVRQSRSPIRDSHYAASEEKE